MIDPAQAASSYQKAFALPLAQAEGSDDAAASDEASGGAFGDMLSQTLSQALSAGRQAEAASKQAVAGGSRDLTGLVTAVSDADQMLSIVVTLRDKMISAYQQVMQMSI
jgi:flagellar hook-basal body complex protein FliE